MLDYPLTQNRSPLWREWPRLARSGFAIAVFLVCVPVFIEAPLAQYFPVWGLLATVPWLVASSLLLRRKATALWGDLLLGFTGSWLAGSLYWGWFRSEPLLHLPIEAIALPLPIYLICRQRWLAGSWFAIGSFLGTAVTDLYFYLTGLIPYWRNLMRSPADMAGPILHDTLNLVGTPWGIAWAVVLANSLIAVALWGLRRPQAHWQAFSGAVLSTILVDVLFLLGAMAS